MFRLPKQMFVSAPAGSYPAVLQRAIDLGTQDDEKYGPKPKIALIWEIDEPMADGRPYTVSKWYSFSMNEKSTFRIHLEAWRGKAFTPEDATTFNLEDLIGKCCLITLARSKDGTKSIVSNVTALPRNVRGPKLQGIPLSLSLNPEDFDEAAFSKLSDSMKKIIKQSPEYKTLMQEDDQEDDDLDMEPSDGEPKDIPF
jgi:hypothetical protein